MRLETIRATGVACAGLGFWQWATSFLETHEPWDSPEYPIVYLGSLGLCAAFGFLFPWRPWRWGLIIIFAQLPIMALHAERVGPLLVVGIGTLALQALPAVLVATAGSRIRHMRRSS